jgi:hypothetical protein
MSDERKPWEIPMQYSDDRWETGDGEKMPLAEIADEQEERSSEEMDALISRGPRVERPSVSNDKTPLDYSKGPHNEVLGVEDRDEHGSPDDDPMDYESGQYQDGFDDQE